MIIRSLFFSLFINVWGAIIPIIYSFVFINNDQKSADYGALIWSRFSLWMLKKICKIDYRIVGLERLPKKPFIIACKHQSIWETMVMHLIFHRPVYIYKKELLKIPFYGWFLKIMSGISLDRDGGASALKSLLKKSKEYLKKDQIIIIFPQGTRVPTNGTIESYPYQVGVAALYSSCNVAVVPAALNSGKFWEKNKIKKTKGTITLEFLDPIYPGLTKEAFMDKLQSVIDEKSNYLFDNPQSLEH